MTLEKDYIQHVNALHNFCKYQKYKGYDPYDTLNGWLPFHWLGKWGPVFAIQFQKRNPINIRPLIGIKKGHNPKAMGLLLNAYSNLYKNTGEQSYRETADYLFQWLIDNYSRGFSGYCWGYNFDWANPVKTVHAYHPNIVATSFVAKGMYNYYSVIEDQNIPEILESICNYIINDLPITENEYGVCFSYTDIKKECCFNANMLGTEILAKTYSITNNSNYLNYIEKAVDFTLAYQKNDGRWNYSIDIESGKERSQIDFHQGYILESLYEIMKCTDLSEKKYQQALEKGTSFYRNVQFTNEGISYWRYPKYYPIEIHNQSQGIITFSLLRDLHPEYLPFAQKIAEWTIDNMQDETGYFYYQKRKYFANKIPYMRWSQAWMLLALTHLICNNSS